MSGDIAHPGPAAVADPGRVRRHRTWLVAGAAVVAVAIGAETILSAPAVESTDDAYTAADATNVAPKVRGLVGAILVRDNQTVHAGDPLVRIDAEEFDARVQSAQSDLLDAEAGIQAANAALASLDAEQRLAAANVEASRTSIRSSQADLERAAADRRRYEALVSTGAVAQHDVDVYRSAAVGAEQAAAHARAGLQVVERAAEVTRARRATLEAALAKAQAQRARARAGLDLALQDQREALVRAPIDGTVGNRQAQVGDYVQPGTRMLTLVPLHALYVTANFKETQLRAMRVGQPVTLDIDALAHPLTGRVESLAPGSGSTFSMLPFEPGTGNFTKIVQRVPVRIHLDDGQPDAARLRPGLSVTAKVRVAS